MIEEGRSSGKRREDKTRKWGAVVAQEIERDDL